MPSVSPPIAHPPQNPRVSADPPHPLSDTEPSRQRSAWRSSAGSAQQHSHFDPDSFGDPQIGSQHALVTQRPGEAALYDPRLARRILREKEAANKRRFFILLPTTLFLAYWALQLYWQ